MSSQANEHLQMEATLNVPDDTCQPRSPLSPFTALRHALCLAPALRCRPGSAPAPCTQAPPRSRAAGPALPSALGKQRVWRFRVYRVGLVGVRAGGMAAFGGPAKPLLSLNPQEDAKFKKEVAQVRRRATKVSGRRGPDREERWRTGSGCPARAPRPPQACASSGVTQVGTRPQELAGRGFLGRTEK